MKISGIYKITNTVTNDFYIGSSKNVKRRWRSHKWKSTWNKCPSNPMYLDMCKYGVDKFDFQILAEVEEDSLKEIEQQFIETLKPTYNDTRAKGRDFERYKENKKEYSKSEKGKESHKKAQNKYDNQLCFYNGQTLTLCALKARLRRQGISNSITEAKKYLIKNNK